MPTSYRNYKNYSYQRDARLPAAAAPRKPFKPQLKLVIFIGCIFVMGIFVKTVFASGGPEEKGAVASVAAEQKEPEKPKKTVDTAALKPTLDQLIKKYPSADTSVSVIELNSGTLVQSGDTYPFIAASTTKILTALAYFDRVEAGSARLDQKIGGVPAEQQMQKMINKSDNPAWKQLNSYLGNDSLAAYAREQGLTTFNAAENQITSNDMALLLSKLYKRELINDNHTNKLLSWMQNTSEERFIPSAVPEDVKLYHKAGYLADRVHDVAVIDNGSTPFVIVIYSKSYTNAYNFTTGQKLYKEVTAAVLQTFSQ